MLKQFKTTRFLALLFLLYSFISWGQNTVTYTVATTSSVTTSGTAPAGSSASYTQSFNTAKQIAKNNNAVLTLSGYTNKEISKITLSMKANSSSGAGTLDVKAGTTTIASVNPSAKFNTASWYGATWPNSYVDIVKNPTAYTVQSGENVVITIAATESSLYIEKYTIEYTTPSTCTAPSTQSTSFSSANIGQTTAQVNWVRGNGDKVLVVGREGSAVNANPVNGTSYAADAILGFGDQIGTGNFVVYNGTGTQVNLTDLMADKTYHFAIYEYNDTGLCYNLVSPLTGNFSTLAPPPSHFRSVASGNWNALATWESSVDGTTWTAASVAPKSTDASIKIRNGHTVTISTSVTADEITVENGGVLSTGTQLTVNDGAGDDIVVENGGQVIYTGLPTFSTNAALHLYTGAILSLQNSGLVGTSSVVHTKTIYDHESILEWNYSSGTPAMSGVTYFPNVDDNTIPIFRFLTSVSSMGGGSASTINGRIELANGVSISFNGAGEKIIRNGIIGSGNFNQSAGGAVKFNGSSSVIGQGVTVNLIAAGLLVNGNLQVDGIIKSGTVTNNGSIVVKEGANFIPNAYSGTGTYSQERTATAAADKYVFWSSPVVGQNMHSIYNPASTTVMTYNTATDYYDVVSNPSTSGFGIGYSVKAPVANAAVSFTGTPNLGAVNTPVVSTANANGNAYNLIGNPYTSNLDMQNFYLDNTTNVGETFYFWNPATGIQGQTGATAVENPGWALYNANSVTWSRAASGTNSIIPPGQGFIVKALTNTVVWNNGMRTHVATGVSSFNKNNGNSGEGKYWLQMKTPTAKLTQMAVTYGPGAQNALDGYDSAFLSIGNDALYSPLENKKLGIHGRAPFVNTDVVLLGNKHSVNGNYTISVVAKTGIFENGQAIYLRDKQNGTYTDLSVQEYNFTASAGELTNRFEIVYLPQGALSTTEISKEELVVYKNADHFVVENTVAIDKITVLDASGRVVKTLTPNAKKAIVEVPSKGVYLLNISSKGKVQTKKIIK